VITYGSAYLPTLGIAMQRSTDTPSHRPSSVRRLATVLLAALLLISGQQAANASAAPERGSAALYAFSVSISGPTALGEYDDATYTAVPSNGTAPYTYTWSKGSTTGTGATFYIYGVRSSFTVYLTAVDALGHQASTSLWVYVQPECRRC